MTARPSAYSKSLYPNRTDGSGNARGATRFSRGSKGPLAVLAALALLAASGLPGCGGEPRGRVFGKVTFRGAPVTQGMVLFNNAAKGVYMSTEIHPDGSYRRAHGKGRRAAFRQLPGCGRSTAGRTDRVCPRLGEVS